MLLVLEYTLKKWFIFGKLFFFFKKLWFLNGVIKNPISYFFPWKENSENFIQSSYKKLKEEMRIKHKHKQLIQSWSKYAYTPIRLDVYIWKESLAIKFVSYGISRSGIVIIYDDDL